MERVRIILAIFVVIIMCQINFYAWGLPSDDIALLLSGYEHVPSAEELLRGRTRAEVERTLIALSADESRPLFVRARATAMLGTFPSDATRARLETLIDEASAHPSIVLAAVRASAKFGAALAVRLHPHLSHPDVHIREAAVVSLAKAGDRAALEGRLVEETNPTIRARIVEMLGAN